MFAFPAMYPAEFFRAASWPLLGVIALSLVSASGMYSVSALAQWILLFAGAALFSWLAVRIHRAVLLPPTGSGGKGGRLLPLVSSYLAALVTATVLKFVFYIAAITLVGVFNARYVPVSDTSDPPLPDPDPDIQRMIDYASWGIEIPLAYLLARFSTLLPALALGHSWSPRTAWEQTRGNGWRLALVVFLLPWLMDEAIDWTYASLENPVLVSLLAILRAMFLALGVIALSLSYRELPPWPAPPPTPRPS